MKTNSIGDKKFNNNLPNLLSIWKENNTNHENTSFTKLFLDDMIGKDWPYIKEKYLS